MRALCAAIVLAVVAPAAAEDRARAEKYFHVGEKAFRAQNFAAAAENFEEAYRALPLPEIAFSAAQAYRRQYRVDPKIDHARRAVELYRVYLDHVKSGGRVADAADALAEMERELDKVTKASSPAVTASPPPTKTRLGVDVSFGGAPVQTGALREVEDRGLAMPADLLVALDGTTIRPFELYDAPPGKHTVHVAAGGYFPRDKDVVAIEGASSMVEVSLDPRPAHVAIATDDGAEIAIDGTSAGRAPHVPIELPAGAHRIAITRRGREPLVRDLAVANDQTVELQAPLEMTSRRRAVPYVAAGAGVLATASIASGIVAYLAERDAQTILDRKNGPGNVDPAQAPAYADDRDRHQTFFTAAWITGGAAVATAAIAFALYRFDEPTPVAPLVAPGGGGVSLTGHF
jgi:hypothetical protein